MIKMYQLCKVTANPQQLQKHHKYVLNAPMSYMVIHSKAPLRPLFHQVRKASSRETVMNRIKPGQKESEHIALKDYEGRRCAGFHTKRIYWAYGF